MSPAAADLPLIISVDDHVVEPADLWTARLPAAYRERGPRIVRRKVKLGIDPAALKQSAVGNAIAKAGWVEADDGTWSDVWLYDDLVWPMHQGNSVVGPPEEGRHITEGIDPITFDDIRRAAWDPAERVKDMDINHVEASVCFPGTFPRFCGQGFLERADKDLALLCVQAYNDWMIDDWCGGDRRGRLIPLTIVPLWDAELAAREIRRCADKGSFAITFSEGPHELGLPSISDPQHRWDPMFAACADVGAIICMHFGSSSKMPQASPDAPSIVSSTIVFQNGMGSMLEFILSGVLERHPELKILYAEHQVGWMPYLLERADKLWEQRGTSLFGSSLPRPPSSYVPGHVYGSIFDDDTGLRNRDFIGMSQICAEVDYPHGDGTYPESREILARLAEKAGLDERETYQLVRGNAITAFGLERFGITA
jgi:predicted TIM-barrel fold metal-dependent hydrolase